MWLGALLAGPTRAATADPALPGALPARARDRLRRPAGAARRRHPVVGADAGHAQPGHGDPAGDPDRHRLRGPAPADGARVPGRRPQGRGAARPRAARPRDAPRSGSGRARRRPQRRLRGGRRRTSASSSSSSSGACTTREPSTTTSSAPRSSASSVQQGLEGDEDPPDQAHRKRMQDRGGDAPARQPPSEVAVEPDQPEPGPLRDREGRVGLDARPRTRARRRPPGSRSRRRPRPTPSRCSACARSRPGRGCASPCR